MFLLRGNCKMIKEDGKLIMPESPESFDKLYKNIMSPDYKFTPSSEQLNKTYEELLDFLKDWIDVPEDYYKIIAVWIIGTYFHKNFDTYPFLYFNAMRGSGKTRCLKIISWLQKNGNGDVLTNPSEAVIFRTAQDRGLIFDEFESQRSKDKAIMREVLNAAYKKGGKVFRMKKVKKLNEKREMEEKQEAEGFDIFTPVALANISGIEEVLQDRCISLILEKSSNPTLTKKMENFAINKRLKALKGNLQVSVGCVCMVGLETSTTDWNEYINSKYTYIHNIHTLHNPTHHTLPMLTEQKIETFNKIDELNIWGRNLELFFPLICVSKIISEDVFLNFLKVIKELNVGKKEDEFTESKDVSLIEFVSLQEKYRYEYVFVNQLTREFKEFIGYTESHDKNDNWVNNEWVALALKRNKLLTERKRVAKGVLIRLAIEKAKQKIKMFKQHETPKEAT